MSNIHSNLPKLAFTETLPTIPFTDQCQIFILTYPNWHFLRYHSLAMVINDLISTDRDTQMVTDQLPEYLRDIYQYVSDIDAHDIGHAANYTHFVISNNSESGKCMFRSRSVILLKSLPAHVKNASSLPSFNRAYTTIQQT